jgi:transposase
VFDVGISTVIRWVALPRDGQHCGKADGRGSSLPTDRGAGLDSRTR